MKNKTRTQMCLFGMILTLSVAPLVQASEEYSSYDDIVRDLKGSEVAASFSDVKKSEFDSIKIHAGAGLTNTRLSLDTPRGLRSSANLRGVELFLGIDLFSSAWVAEGAVRSYVDENYSGTNLSLKEFDLKIIYQNPLSSRTYWRAGAGMAARYLDLEVKPAQLEKRTYTTPASLFVAGLGTRLSPSFSAGIDFSYKNTLINDTIDKSAVDGNIRFTGTF